MKHFDDIRDDDLLAPGFSMVAAARLTVLSCIAILAYLAYLAFFK